MSLPDRLERGGIVLGCSILLALPTSALLGVFADAIYLPWQLSLLALVPGIPVGFLVIADPRLTYTHVWRFALTHWVAALALWQVFDISPEGTDLGLAIVCWLAAFGIGVLAATTSRWLPRLRA